MAKECDVVNCPNKYRAIGLCSTHWKIFKKYGSATPLCFCGELSHVNGGNRGGTLMCKSHTLLHRFWENVDIKADEECWVWTAAKTAAGYGVIYWNNENTYTHRLSIELDGKEIPERFHACHSCDNPPCVNPKHLFVGSPRDNMLDKVSKGRHPHGESHYATKLSDSQIFEIRKLASDNIILADIARIFDITPNYVSQIINKTRRILKEV